MWKTTHTTDVKTTGLETSNHKSTIQKYNTQFYLLEAIPMSYSLAPTLHFMSTM